jgi:hypothetical protein
MTSRSDVLKTANMKWLVMLAALDAAVVLLLLAPELEIGWKAVALRAGAASLLPVVVLLLTGLLSHEAKARLVYWKIANPLPGSTAFTKHAPADVRIGMKALARNVGALPTDPGEQNAKWYKLYRLVSDDSAVAHAHRLYLMYRDMAAMSLLLVPLLPAAILYAGAPSTGAWNVAALMAVQYLACVISARHSGRRFVCNVLAIHSTKKVTA